MDDPNPLKRLVREVTPPFLWRSASSLLAASRFGASPGRGFEHGVEQPPEYYDHTYETKSHWKRHYTESEYYPLWTVIADRIRRSGVEKVIDIGCGPGQVACLLRDAGLREYTGLDFSEARVARARAVCPEYEFIVADVFADKPLVSHEYDCVLIMEFLEHVDQDLEILGQTLPGKHIVGTVPNFPGVAHVRHFNSAEEVRARYGPILSDIEVSQVLANKRGKVFYVLQGTR